MKRRAITALLALSMVSACGGQVSCVHDPGPEGGSRFSDETRCYNEDGELISRNGVPVEDTQP